MLPVADDPLSSRRPDDDHPVLIALTAFAAGVLAALAAAGVYAEAHRAPDQS